MSPGGEGFELPPERHAHAVREEGDKPVRFNVFGLLREDRFLRRHPRSMHQMRSASSEPIFGLKERGVLENRPIGPSSP